MLTSNLKMRGHQTTSFVKLGELLVRQFIEHQQTIPASSIQSLVISATAGAYWS